MDTRSSTPRGNRTRIRTALVIGGGIAGPVAAMALQKAGIEATVHEAYDSGADTVGAGLGLAPNGLDALDAIGAGHCARSVASPMRSIVLRGWNGRRLAEFSSPSGLPDTQLLWRADLYRELYAEARGRGVRIEHGKRLVSVKEEDDRVTACFADGSTARGDLLIGADGIRSTVRGLIDPANPEPRYAGLLGFGGLVRDSGLAPTDERMLMVFGKRAFLGYQVHPDGSALWFVNLPSAEPLSLAECRAVGAAQWLDRLRRALAEDRAPGLRLLDRTDPAELMMTGPAESMPSVPRWSRDRLVLAGDSAHAPSSSSGQGASLAVESAVQLARCVRDLPPDQALAAYERLRRERVERVIREAERTNSNKAAGPVARVLRDRVVLPLLMRLAKPEREVWKLAHHIDWAAEVTG